MAEVIQCDKCEEICAYDGRYTVDIAHHGEHVLLFDLCSKCKNELLKFLNNQED